MGITYIALFLATIFTTASCQNIPPGALTKLISEIMSPRKTEQVAQIIKGASQVPLTRRSAIIDANLPRKILGTDINSVLVQRPNEVVLQRNAKSGKVVLQNEGVLPNNVVLLQKPNQQRNKLGKIFVQKNDGLINEIGFPKKVVIQKNELGNSKIIVKKPELAMPKKVLVKNVEMATPNARKILVQKANEIPLLKNSKLVFNGNPQVLIQNLKEPLTKIRGVDIKVAQNVIVKQPRVVNSVPQGSVVGTKAFLPAASSVLGTTPKTSPQSKGQFLRKIPIPPPSI